MKWYSDLYISDSIGKKANKIKWKINHSAGTLDTYVIAFPSNPDNLLDMIPTTDLLQKAYPKDNLHIIGLAKGYYEGIELIQQIITDAYEATGDVNIKKYLKSKGRETE